MSVPVLAIMDFAAAVKLAGKGYIALHAVVPGDLSITAKVAIIEVSISDVYIADYAVLFVFQVALDFTCANSLEIVLVVEWIARGAGRRILTSFGCDRGKHRQAQYTGPNGRRLAGGE